MKKYRILHVMLYVQYLLVAVVLIAFCVCMITTLILIFDKREDQLALLLIWAFTFALTLHCLCMLAVHVLDIIQVKFRLYSKKELIKETREMFDYFDFYNKDIEGLTIEGCEKQLVSFDGIKIDFQRPKEVSYEVISYLHEKVENSFEEEDLTKREWNRKRRKEKNIKIKQAIKNKR